jgi:DNA polymerase III epsilon subunit family exonuclease
MSYTEFVVLDVETTGVNPATDDIIEFAAVKLDASGQVIDQLDLLISTSQPIVPIVIALTGIRPADLAGQPRIEAVMDKILAFIGTAPIVGHNIGFDIDFLNAKGAALTNPVLDTLELAYTVLPAQPYYSLEYLSRRFNFAHQPSHRAMADVLATVDLFKLLVGQVTGLQSGTRQQINQLVPAATWTWGWLFHEPLAWSDASGTVAMEISDYLISEIELARPHLPVITTARPAPVAFWEIDFDVDPLALALLSAADSRPAVVVLPEKVFYQTDWQLTGQALGVSIAPWYGSRLVYRPEAEVELANHPELVGSLQARLITKVVIWRHEWGMDYGRLYLSRDEKYQWEQKLAPRIIDQTSPVLPTVDVVVATPEAWLELTDMSSYSVITAHPLLIEDAAFTAQVRVLSVNYLTAAVSHRRDFVHQFVRPVDVKVADRLFKMLNHLGTAFQAIGQALGAVYADYPPTSVYERNIELTNGMISDDLRQSVAGAISQLDSYTTELTDHPEIDAADQVERTRRLISDLQSVVDLPAERRHFLYADDHRFFLELVPTESDFSRLRQLVQSAREFTVVSPGLSIAGRFDYWQSVFGAGEGRSVSAGAAKSELLVASDLPEGGDAYDAFQQVAANLTARTGKTLLLAHSTYDARQLFHDIYESAAARQTVVESYETVGNVTLVPDLLSQHVNFMLVGHYFWLDRLPSIPARFDRVILTKLPFEPVSRPQTKILGGDDGFEQYTLPRGILRLKEVLHLARRIGQRLVMLDSRLVTRDYGARIVASLSGFTVIPEPSDQILD